MTQPVPTATPLQPGQSFAGLAHMTSRYRESTGSWLAIKGTCLSPFLVDGDAVYMDPTVEAYDGDLVVAAIAYVVEKRVSFYGPTPDRDVYRPTKIEKRLSVKVLRVIAGECWLVTAVGDAMRLADLHDGELVGVVTGWYRAEGDGERPPMEELRRLAPPEPLART